MRSKKTIWLAFAVAVSAGTSLVACSSDDPNDRGDDAADASSPTTDGADVGNAPDGTVKDAATDHVDAGKHDATVDSATPVVDAGKDGAIDTTADATLDAPFTVETGTTVPTTDASPDSAANDAATDASASAPTGSPCAQDQLVQKRLCGYCGTESRICLVGDAGTPVWQEWGGCRGETTAAARCLPGATRSNACGNCGMQPQTCQNDCTWQGQICNTPPTAVCTPNTRDYVAGLSCDAGGRVRFCQNDCSYTDFGDCVDPAHIDGGTSLPTGAIAIALSTSAGSNKVTVNRSLVETTTQPRIGTGTCPVSSISTSATPFDYIVIGNPDSFRTAKVSVWTSARPGDTTTYIDGVIAAYAGRATIPVTDADRKACTTGVNDTCSSGSTDPTACISSWAGLFNESGVDRRVTLAPGQTAVVYVAGYFSDEFGDYMLSLRTEVLQ